VSGERDCCPLKGTAAVETRAGIVAAAEGRHTGDMVFAGDVGDHEARARRVSDGQLAVTVICLAMLLAGCGGSLRGDASTGPNPGGGFYSPSNIDNGRVNP